MRFAGSPTQARVAWTLVGLGTAVTLMAAPFLSLSCTTHGCDASTVSLDASILQVLQNSSNACYDGAAKAGAASAAVLTQNGSALVWQSSPFFGTWFCFGPQETVTFTLPPAFANAEISDIVTLVSIASSPSEDPTDDGGNFTVASGNLAEVALLPGSSEGGGPSFSVVNTTCQQYFAYVTVTASLVSDDGGVDDAGVDSGDAG